MTDKYLIVNPFPAGFTNVLMSYEIAFAVAFITGRALIIPPTSWCVLIDEKTAPKESWQNIWEVCDINLARQEFEIHNLLEVTELLPYICDANYSWVSPDVPNLKEFHSIVDSNTCYHVDIVDNTDFEKFSNSRPTVNINSDSKFMTFTAFGHYWYNIYASGPSNRNLMKDKINTALRYKDYYYDLTKSVINEKYNAIHVRDPNQLMYDQYSDVVLFKGNPDIILNQVRILFDNDKPLYIATDITNKTLFSKVAEEYNVIFYEDLGLPELKPLEKIAVDQIICSRAELFYGSYYSTFSKRINIMRGLEKRQSSDYMGFNKIIDEPDFYKNPMPWQNNGFKHWDWYASSHVQWMKE